MFSSVGTLKVKLLPRPAGAVVGVFGSEAKLSSSRATGLMRSAGMRFPGNGRPVNGSRMGGSPLKSPPFSAGVGIAVTLVVVTRRRSPS
jgi:hypothetical protein